MTFGLIAGSVLAHEQYGPLFFLDPKVLLSFLMWVVYVVLLFTRWNSGWRGRAALSWRPSRSSSRWARGLRTPQQRA